MRVGIVGCGRFGSQFVKQFTVHPLVEAVYVADLHKERAMKIASKCNIPEAHVMTTLDEMLVQDIDSVVIYAQRQLHGPMVVQALKAGKNVCCAVPMATSEAEIRAIVELVEETGLIYMTNETDTYIADVMYCREKYQKGEFGRFTYAEAAYNHDMSHFIDPFKYSGGENWKRIAGFPPMLYATHTVSRILSVTGAHIESVYALGVHDYNEDAIFRPGNNDWDNPYAYESALMRTSDGGVIRINEGRRVVAPGQMPMFSFQGENATFIDGGKKGVKFFAKRTGEDGAGVEEVDVTTLLRCGDFKGPIDPDIPVELRGGFFSAESPFHNAARLPESFKDIRNGHNGSHHFLVDDFVRCVTEKKHPKYTNVWQAAKYCIPGIIAHEAAMEGGVVKKVPYFGEIPSRFEVLDADENAFDEKMKNK